MQNSRFFPCVLFFVCAGVCRGDEGMWLLSSPPVEQLKSKYKFEPKAEWLEHLQKSCVHMGASASLVSADGLVLTNHHVGSDQLYKLSTPERDLLRDGFYARTREEEIKCPDLEVKILWSTQDVTQQVNAAVAEGLPAAEAYQARRKAMTRIEEESNKETGLDSEVVTLWHGARYHLYRYRRYDDVRLVMAPEKAIAFFGGDTDNFEYPRYDYDCCFFRIYDHGRPLKAEHYLRWSRNGASDGELLFVCGHPRRTRRLLTVDHLKFLRDDSMPNLLDSLWRRESQLVSFCNRSAEHARIGEDDLFSIQNRRKAVWGTYQSLVDPAFLRRKQETEEKLRSSTHSEPPAGAGGGPSLPRGVLTGQEPWERIAAAEQEFRSFYLGYGTIEEIYPLSSQLFGIARTIVRLADELPKPSPERLREYRESELESVYLQLYSPAPIYDALEIDTLASWISLLAETFGAEDPLVVKVLDGLSPRARAERLVRGTRLKDVETRKRLVKEGKEGVDDSNDPMIRLMASIDAEARALRKRFEDEVEGVERENYAKIAAAQFALYGERLYPDATGTLRLSFGPVRGYEEDGRPVPPFTTTAGLFQRWKERGPHFPFNLPQRWIEARDKLDPETPFNFVLTADIIGGNSGSPVVNSAGELVGLIFDSNLQGLISDIAYSDDKARAIAVDARIMLEGLRKVYGADALVDEITRE